MPDEKDQARPGTDLAPSFAVELDEDLLAAALSAVEGISRDASTASPTPELGADIDIELDLEAEGQGAEFADASPTAGLDQARAEAVQARAQLDSERTETGRLRRQLDELDQERRRLRGALRRLEEQITRDAGKLERERETRRGAEDQLNQALRRVDLLETELQTMRERRRKEREDERQAGSRSAVEAVLPSLDHLELAISHKHEDPRRVVEGIAMVVQQFHQALAQLGVSRIVAGPGVLFDPEIHEALAEVSTDELLPGSVVSELRPGYALHGRLLRAARVSVAIGATPAASTAEDAPATEAQPPSSPLEVPQSEGSEPLSDPEAPSSAGSD